MSDNPPTARIRRAPLTHDDQDDFLLTREVAEMLRTPESTVRYWRHVRTGPPSIKVGRRVLYRRQAVIAWLRDRESATPEAAGAERESRALTGRSAVPAPRRWPSR